MTDEEKKAQEAAAAQAAETQNAGGESTGEAGSQGAGGEKGNNQSEKTPRDIVFERVRTSRPDAKYDEDEQEIYRQLTSLLDEAEDGNGKYKSLTEKLMRRYKDAPEEVAALLDYMEGTPLVNAIVKNMGEEALQMKEGDEGWDSYQEAIKKRRSDREGYERLMSEVEGNMNSAVNSFDKWAEGKKLDDAQRQQVWDDMTADLNKMSRGIFDDGIFERYYKAAAYEGDVEGARAQGEADGKNAAIEAKREQMKGSGLPSASAGGAKKEEHELTEREKLAQRMQGWRRG